MDTSAKEPAGAAAREAAASNSKLVRLRPWVTGSTKARRSSFLFASSTRRLCSVISVVSRYSTR